MNDKINFHLGRAFLAGFLATIVMTLVWYLPARSNGVPIFDFAAFLGSLSTSQTALPGNTVWWLGMAEHFIFGSILFPLFYATLFFPRITELPGVKGAAFAVLLWIGSQLVIAPVMGLGFFSTQSANPVVTWFITFNAHLIYGIVLGGILGWRREETVAIPTITQHDRERRAA